MAKPEVSERPSDPPPSPTRKILKALGIALGLIVLAIIGKELFRAFPERATTAQVATPPRPPPPSAESLLVAMKMRLEQGNYSRAIYHGKRFMNLYPNAPEVAQVRELLTEARATAQRAGMHTRLRQEEQREQAERERRQRSLASKWTYRATTDDMTGRTSRTAWIRSENTVSFDFPYQGPQRATLTLRTHPSYGQDAILRIERGQLLCNSYDRCRVRIRFDDGSPQTWRGNPPADHSTTVLFLRGYDRFLQQLRRSDMVRIQPEVFQEGNPVFVFHVGGYDHSRYTGR